MLNENIRCVYDKNKQRTKQEGNNIPVLDRLTFRAALSNRAQLFKASTIVDAPLSFIVLIKSITLIFLLKTSCENFAFQKLITFISTENGSYV